MFIGQYPIICENYENNELTGTSRYPNAGGVCNPAFYSVSLIVGFTIIFRFLA